MPSTRHPGAVAVGVEDRIRGRRNSLPTGRVLILPRGIGGAEVVASPDWPAATSRAGGRSPSRGGRASVAVGWLFKAVADAAAVVTVVVVTKRTGRCVSGAGARRTAGRAATPARPNTAPNSFTAHRVHHLRSSSAVGRRAVNSGHGWHRRTFRKTCQTAALARPLSRRDALRYGATASTLARTGSGSPAAWRRAARRGSPTLIDFAMPDPAQAPGRRACRGDQRYVSTSRPGSSFGAKPIHQPCAPVPNRRRTGDRQQYQYGKPGGTAPSGFTRRLPAASRRGTAWALRTTAGGSGLAHLLLSVDDDIDRNTWNGVALHQ